MRTLRFTIVVWIIITLVGCASATRTRQGGQHTQYSEPESRLRAEAQMLEEAISNSGRLYSDEQLSTYLQRIIVDLFPEHHQQITVKLHRSPAFNAFALPNGGIYINLGMLASLENEAQIAAILAHEGVHYLREHSERQRDNINSSVGVGLVLNSFGLVGSLLSLGVLSSISGYSQSLEYEADSHGFNYFIAAGYKGSEAVTAFQVLEAEVKHSGHTGGGMFSSHPKLANRIKNYKKLCDAPGVDCDNGHVRVQQYMDSIKLIRRVALQDKLEAGKYDEIIASLGRKVSCEKDVCSELYAYYLAEAYRRRNSEGDADKAVNMLSSVLVQRPDHAQAHQSLALLYMKQDRKQESLSHFRRSLECASDGEQELKAFSQHYIKTLED